MMRQVAFGVANVCLLLILAGCSVGMALSGKKDPNLGAFRVGSTRGEVELQLGGPVSSVSNPNGSRTDVYEYDLGNEPSAGRAIGHGVMDVLTLGLWEFVGTPIEGFTGTKHQMTIVYGPDDRVAAINQPVPVTAPVGEKKEEAPGTPERHASLGGPETRPVAKAITGTCFAVNPNGTLLTAYHLVKDAKAIRVHLPGGTVTEARVQTTNAKKDLAILRIEPRTPYFLPLASGDSVRVGEQVFTMGYPLTDILGQEPKFTEGSISSLSGVGGEPSLMQISVPLQPGNSGGPLVNARGEAVGVVTSTAAVQAFFAVTGTLPQNVNWAVKADYARSLFDPPAVRAIAISREDAVAKVSKTLCMVEAN